MVEEINRSSSRSVGGRDKAAADQSLAISPHMRSTGHGLLPQTFMAAAAAWKKRMADCLGSISKMGEDELKEVTRAVKERRGSVKKSKSK